MFIYYTVSFKTKPYKRFRYGKDERIVSQNSDGMSLENFDAEEFFRYMFGGDEFADIIGDFELAKSFNYALSELFSENEQTGDRETHHFAHMTERAVAHEERITKLSENLKLKLSNFTDRCQSNQAESLEKFIEEIRSDIPVLLQAPYGEHLLHTIGYIYSTKARTWLSKMDSQEGPIGRRILSYGKNIQSKWKDRIHVVKETVKTVKCAVQWQQSMSRLASATDEETNESQMIFQHHSGHLEYSGMNQSESTTSKSSPVKPKQKSSTQSVMPLTEEEKRKLEMETSAKSMEALWRATKLEIESVQRDVCDRVLSDSSCSREVLRYRCKALSKMGELWQQAALSN